MVDSNYNNTEVPADLPEEQASQSSVRVVDQRQKQKPETVESPSITPMNERKWIDVEPSEFSLSLCIRGLEKSRQSSSTLSNDTTRR